jgi:hypothetical protein
MKVIISHDVDHIRAWEHKNDLIIPKHIVRNIIEFGLGKISLYEINKRFKNILKNKWHNMESLMQFNNNHNIPSTFFFGVSNGKGLNYGLKDAKFWMIKVMQEGFHIGVHGIAFDNLNDIKKEYETFTSLTSLTSFGIRMHYLRSNNNTLNFLDKTGYIFDSSIPEMRNPFKIGRLWEFPLHIMDGYIFCRQTRWQNQTLNQAKDSTIKIIEHATELGLHYFTILFHDRYFSDSFQTWKEWYIWLIEYLINNRFEFISYHEAINELEMISER